MGEHKVRPYVAAVLVSDYYNLKGSFVHLLHWYTFTVLRKCILLYFQVNNYLYPFSVQLFHKNVMNDGIVKNLESLYSSEDLTPERYEITGIQSVLE